MRQQGIIRKQNEAKRKMKESMMHILQKGKRKTTKTVEENISKVDDQVKTIHEKIDVVIQLMKPNSP